MEQRSLRVYDTNKTFIAKIANTITKLLIPTRVGLNGMLISIKRNTVLKSYEAFIQNTTSEDVTKREVILKKYEDTFALYLDSIDKYIMDSIYKKVKNNTATEFEKNALSDYYTVTHLKETEFLEYKYRKQQYLLKLDYETVTTDKKDKIRQKYIPFYISKMDTLYKGLLKHYSVQLADTSSNRNKEEVYDKIFKTLEEYITDILPIKMEVDTTDTYKNILEEYDKFERFTIGKLDKKDKIEKNVVLLGISRQLFTHSLPLVVAEQCYNKLLEDTRQLISDTKIAKKREMVYELLIDLVEEYNVKLLSTKIYWDKPNQREEYKKFWDSYKKINELKETDFIKYMAQKEILFIKDDLKKLWNTKIDYTRLIKFYKSKLAELGAIRRVKNSCKTIANCTKSKVIKG